MLFGVTAGRKKRRHVRQYFQQVFGKLCFAPWLPYPLGLRASAAWVSFLLRKRMARDRPERIHFVLYIGGGILLRLLYGRGERWPIGRTVWNRGPLQERVAKTLCSRVPRLVLTLIGYRSIVDLAGLNPKDLTFPPSPAGAGLIVETKSSALAQRLGIDEASLDLSQELLCELLPDARDRIALPLSHDEIYEDRAFLDQAAAFLQTGSFQAVENGTTG